MRLSIVLPLVLAFLQPASAADWGDLTMRFVYDGEPPQPKHFQGDSSRLIADESLSINKSDRGIQNVIVYLLPALGEKVAVHPDYAQSAASTVTLKVSGGNFRPRVTIVRTSQTLAFQNADAVGYSLKIDMFSNKPFAALLPGRGSVSTKFTAEEHMPASLSSTIHPWLVGLLLIRDSPYFALSDEHGRLKIGNLPTGKHTFVVWHERTGYVKHVHRETQPVTWPRGRMTVDIQPGDNDLGEIKLAPEVFRQR